MLTRIQRLTQLHLTSRERQYWTAQLVGWSALTTLSYFSLALWYNPGQWGPAIHTLVQSVTGLIVAHPLRWVASSVWEEPWIKRVLVNAAGILIASLVWTVLRIVTFDWITVYQITSDDYGGWLFASVTIYGAWSFCYHALRYYRQWLEQRELAITAQQSVLEARERAQNEKFKRLTAENLYQESQLRMLKYQLNPHFLFNALNSVTALVTRGEDHSATAMLSQIGAFLRITLEHDDQLEHTIADELEILHLYEGIEKTRFGDRLQTEWNVEPDVMEATIPSFLLQPLFENAVRYAVGKSLSPTQIVLSAWRMGERLEIRLSDTGPGINQDAADDETASTGVGLRNVRKRLESSFGENFAFKLAKNTPTGTTVELSLPYRTNVALFRQTVSDKEDVPAPAK